MSEEKSNQEKQGLPHSGRAYPVIHVFWSDGYPTNIRRKGGGTLVEAGVAFVNEIIKSLPQNSATPQAKQSPSTNDTTDA